MRLLLVGIFLAGAVRAGGAQAPGPPEQRQLIELERRWNDAILRGHRAEVGAFMAEDWTEITSDGHILTKTEDLAELEGGGYKATLLELSELQVRLLGDAAVVTGVTNEKSSYRGRDTGGRTRWMDVFVRKDGRWLCVASQVTRVAGP